MSTAPSSDKANVGEGGGDRPFVVSAIHEREPWPGNHQIGYRTALIFAASLEAAIGVHSRRLRRDDPKAAISQVDGFEISAASLQRIAALSPSPLVLGGQGVSSCTFVSAATPQEGRPANVEPSAGEG